MKTILFIAVVFMTSCKSNSKKMKVFDSNHEMTEQEEMESKELNSYDPSSEPICPAHPDGARVLKGSKWMYDENHKGCSTERCLEDLKEEQNIRHQQEQRKMLEEQLGYPKSNNENNENTLDYEY